MSNRDRALPWWLIDCKTCKQARRVDEAGECAHCHEKAVALQETRARSRLIVPPGYDKRLQ
jgi:hypothetical protein